MRGVRIFLLRSILAAAFAWIIGRIFFPSVSTLTLAGFAVALLVAAYLFEHTKRKDPGGTHGNP